MSSAPIEYPNRVNLDNCAKEPIHIIGKTQAHGVLLACDAKTLKITQVGENTAEFFGIPHQDLLEQPVSKLLGSREIQKLEKVISSKEDSVPQEVEINDTRFLMLAHEAHGHLILDFEPLLEAPDPYFFQRQLTRILNRFQTAKSIEKLSRSATKLIKKVFAYDRVMIYRFDEQWNGEVIAESKLEEMESWLGLHYPATDIPAQSRELFLKHRVRIITDVTYNPVPIAPKISPVTGEPLDISRSTLRAVSPIHIEYLQNMKVGASLSAAIVVRGKLWGLIACHHNSAKFLDFYQRESVRFLAQMFSTEVTLHETSGLISRSEQSERVRRQLVVQMKTQKDIVAALNRDTVNFTQLISCGGGALYIKDDWEVSGHTPSKEQLDSLLENFIKKQPKSLFWTRNLSAVFPEAETYKETASGIMSLKISENKFIFWFRPEEIEEVTWGGNPENKAFYNEEEQRLSPRKSFEKWSERLTGISEEWHELDRNIARALRENISYVLLARQREEIEILNAQLMEVNQELELFSYGLSHDLRAPIRGMEGFLTILEEDHEDELSEDGKKLLHMSRGLTEKMNDLIDNILEYSRLSHIEGLEIESVDTSQMIGEILELFNITGSYPKTSLNVQPQMPFMKGDKRMLFQLWGNLISNAFKYSAEEEAPRVEIGTTVKNGREVFVVKDNGIGIKPEYREKVFETFKRAVGSRFKGSGIGLAIVKKITEKHGGKVWVESEPGQGSEFYFYLEPLN